MEKISINQIGLYNPQRMSDYLVETLFIVRESLFEYIFDKIIKEKTNSIPQHYLIIAQRGMGKTTLLKRMEVELRKQKYAKNFIPLLFPEEQYNIKNLAEFCLNCLDALADTLELEKLTTDVKNIDAKIKELAKIKDDESLAKEAFLFFKSVCQSIKRRPVMLIDNMSFVFDRLNKSEQHTLRAWLMQNNAPVLLGASAVAIEDTFNYGAPFYDAFQIHYLNKLSFEELLDLLQSLAKATHTEELLPDIQNKIARIKTIFQLTGGNPRTAVMLFKLIVKGFSKEINDDLESLLDEVTPLYKARFEELPLQMQSIVDAIALNWDPIHLDQLRTETRLENNQLSPQLKRLTEIGWIEKITTDQTKSSAYQISERFFNIWFLMRRSSRRQKKELYCLSKYLESFYGDELPDLAQNRLYKNYENLNEITYSLAVCETLTNKQLKKLLQEKSYAELQKLAYNNPDILDFIGLPKLYMSKLIKDSINIYNNNIKDKDFTNAEIILDKLIDLTRKNKVLNAKIYNRRGNLYRIYLKKYEEAEKAYFKSIELDNKIAQPWNGLGHLYQIHLKKYEEAEKAYLKAIELDKNIAHPWNGLGNLYQTNLQRYEEAEKAYFKAIELDKNFAFPWNGLGHLYQKFLQKYEESEKAYFKAIELNKNYASPWIGLGHLYRNFIQKYEESEKSYLNALELDKNSTSVWNNLGNLYQDHLQKYEESEKAYLKAIELDNSFIYPKYNLVFLYRDKLNKIAEAEELFNTIPESKDVEDSFWLNKALFELYKHNQGIANEYFANALQKIIDVLPATTKDDWWRFGAVVSRLGYGNWAAEQLEESGFDIILAPYYVAIKALNHSNAEGYLNSKAVEIREPARQIIEIMKKY